MKRGRSTTTPTKAEDARIKAVKRAGCVCCWQLGYEHDADGPEVEAHHLLSGGIRRGHMAVIGLCAWHHRGRQIVSLWSLGQHRLELGPSLAEGSVPFHERFGSDEQLLDHQAQLLGTTEE